MRTKLRLPIGPFSINAMYYRDGKIKTKEARDWERSVLHILNYPHIIKALAPLREFFKPKEHKVTVYLKTTYPLKEFTTKAGVISSHTMDLSNWEKPLIDLLFLPKHFENEYSDGAPNLNFDDKYITRLISEKVDADIPEVYIDVIVKIQSRTSSNKSISNFSKSE